MSGGQPPTARQYTEHSHCPVCEEFRSDLAKSDAALAAAAEQLRAVMEENEKLQADNSRLNEIIASYSRASILNREELKRANERLAAAEKTARLCHKHISCLKRDAQREYELYPTDYNCRYDWIELSDLLELIESMPPTPNPTEADRE